MHQFCNLFSWIGSHINTWIKQSQWLLLQEATILYKYKIMMIPLVFTDIVWWNLPRLTMVFVPLYDKEILKSFHLKIKTVRVILTKELHNCHLTYILYYSWKVKQVSVVRMKRTYMFARGGLSHVGNSKTPPERQLCITLKLCWSSSLK